MIFCQAYCVIMIENLYASHLLPYIFNASDGLHTCVKNIAVILLLQPAAQLKDRPFGCKDFMIYSI
jgi:hypothetical protein